MKGKILFHIFPLVVFIVVILFLWRGLNIDSKQLPSSLVNKALPKIELLTLTDPNNYLVNQDFAGKVILLNVWASWCSVCAQEQKMLMEINSSDVVDIYGINYKDKREDALAYLKRYGNPYKAIGIDSEGNTGIDLGVYGTPETFIIDKQGIVRYRIAGPITRLEWSREIMPLILKLKGDAL